MRINAKSPKSRLQNLGIFRERSSAHKIRIIPKTRSGLNLDQQEYMVDTLFDVQSILGKDEVVGLEYDGRHFTLRKDNSSERNQIR